MVFIHVKLQGYTHLMQVAQADGGAAAFLRAGQGGQQQRGQNRDDGDDHQQFDERERAAEHGSSRTVLDLALHLFEQWLQFGLGFGGTIHIKLLYSELAGLLFQFGA